MNTSSTTPAANGGETVTPFLPSAGNKDTQEGCKPASIPDIAPASRVLRRKLTREEAIARPFASVSAVPRLPQS